MKFIYFNCELKTNFQCVIRAVKSACELVFESRPGLDFTGLSRYTKVPVKIARIIL